MPAAHTATTAAVLKPVSRYETLSATHRELGLWVRGAGMIPGKVPGWEGKLPGKDLKGRILGDYAAVYVRRGMGWFQSAPSGHLEIRPGDLFWLFPPVEHIYSPYDGWAEQWVIFNGPSVETYEKHGFLDPRKPLVHVGEDSEVASIFSRIEDVFLKGGPLAVHSAAALVHQLVVRVHGLNTGLLGEGHNADTVVADALRLIESEAQKALTPENVAERLHVSYPTLRRRFRQVTGYSVKEYMLRTRLKRAKELLGYSRRSVAEIAEAVGFEDAFYFSRLFRQREGLSPREFRQKQER